MFRKMGDRIAPIDETGCKILARLDQGELCEVEHVRGRNLKNHKRFMAFAKATFEMQDHFDNKKAWLTELKIMAHFVDTHIDSTGKVFYIVKSISFAKLKEDEFKEVFKNAITGYLQKFGTGITEDELLDVIRFD